VTSHTADPPTRWAIVLTCVGGGVLLGFQVGKAPPMIGAIAAELDLDLVASGFFMSLINAVVVLTGVVAGLLADNTGRRRSLVIGVLLLIAGNVTGASAGSADMLFLSRLMEALAFGAIITSAPGMIMQASRPRDVGIALSAWSTYMPGGFAVMMALSPLIANPENWRTIWWLNAAIAAAYLVLFLIVCRDVGQRPTEQRRLKGLAETLKRPGPWLLGTAFGLYTIQWFGVLTWLPSMMKLAGLSTAQAGWGVALVVGGNAFGALAAGFVLRRGVPRWSIIAGCSLGLGLCTLGIFDDSLPIVWRLALAGLFSTVGGLLPGSVLSGAAVHSPSPAQVGVVNGMIAQCTNLGSLLGPPLVALVASSANGDFTVARWLTLTAGVCGVCVALAIRGVEKRLGADTA